jgi:GNAT superfamily N-acetyltransferase
MPVYDIRSLAREDLPEVMALQRAYQRVYPAASIVPGEVYFSAGFEGGRNVICAFDDEGHLQGYAPLFPNLTTDAKIAHTLWAEVKAHPDVAPAGPLKDYLFQLVVERAKTIARSAEPHGMNLTFQYHTSEAESIAYVESKGCRYTESVFRMVRRLSEEIVEIAAPVGIEVRAWKMESEAEQRAYVDARNEAFPEAPLNLADWQYFMGSPVWKAGTSITAFDGAQIAGSLAAFWDAAENAETGNAVGFTEYIFVRAAWRRRGIAACLISRGLSFLKEHSLEEAQLEVKAANQDALGLYRRLGYEVVDESRFFVLRL